MPQVGAADRKTSLDQDSRKRRHPCTSDSNQMNGAVRGQLNGRPEMLADVSLGEHDAPLRSVAEPALRRRQSPTLSAFAMRRRGGLRSRAIRATPFQVFPALAAVVQ